MVYVISDTFPILELSVDPYETYCHTVIQRKSYLQVMYQIYNDKKIIINLLRIHSVLTHTYALSLYTNF